MKRAIWLTAGVVVLLAGSVATAQGPYQRPQTNPFGTPAISPYLNLTRPGDAGLNYFNLVQPQIQTYNQLQALGTATAHNAALLQTEALNPNRVLLDTGHPTRFMNYTQYFQNVGGASPTASAATPAVIAPAPNTLRGGR